MKMISYSVYASLPEEQNEDNYNIYIYIDRECNKSPENISKYKYMGKITTNTNEGCCLLGCSTV
jgi:hypothetical protein